MGTSCLLERVSLSARSCLTAFAAGREKSTFTRGGRIRAGAEGPVCIMPLRRAV
jgi:hypothetical protein